MATNGHVNGNGTAATPKYKLYTNHGCPYAQRAHITLDELKLPYEEVIIDLNVPRPQWYLDINPRGLVPSLEIDGKDIITESAIVSQYLADYHASHLLPESKDALKRARINFFIDTWNNKVSSQMFAIARNPSVEEKEKEVDAWTKVIQKEIEPLLKGAAPFFGGSKELTFAEVIAAPFVLRWFAMAEDGEVLPRSFVAKVNKLPNFGPWAEAVRKHPSVTRLWDDGWVEQMKARIRKMNAESK